jgi:catechol 2,3-dioxygenase-like lactoylglutathione lyase family enzyme
MRIHHLALRTRDLPRLRAFYVEALGLAPSNLRGSGVWLQAGDAIVMLEQAEESEPAVPAGSRELVAFAVEPGQLPAFEARLAQHGVAIEARTRHTLYFRDPDGRRVGVSQYGAGDSAGSGAVG